MAASSQPARPLNRIHAFALPAATVLLLVDIAGCSVFKSNVEAQDVITKRVTGMPAGDFFQTYGRWKTRSERSNGSTDYDWDSAVGSAPPGPYGLDERVCKLHIVADKAGRIETAVIVLDNPGRLSTSRCGEMFRADGSGIAIPTGVKP